MKRFCSELESGNDKLAIHTPMSIIAIQHCLNLGQVIDKPSRVISKGCKYHRKQIGSLFLQRHYVIHKVVSPALFDVDYQLNKCIYHICLM